jgi:hypothetical protein
MNRNGRQYNKLQGGFNAYPFRPAVSRLVASTGLIPNFRGVEPDELHVPFANWEGPGTKVEKRLARGDLGTTASDTAARQHDIDYMNIGKQIKSKKMTEDQARDAIRESDYKLLNAVEAGRKTDTSLLNKLHASAADTGIRIKNIAEDLHLLKPTKFINTKPDEETKEEINLGSGKKMDPAAKLRKLAKLSKKINVGGADTEHKKSIQVSETALRNYLASLPTDVLSKMNQLEGKGKLMPLIGMARSRIMIQ